MIRILPFFTVIFLAHGPSLSQAGEIQSDSPARYIVRIVHGAPADLTKVPFTGNAGVYLGAGKILTASHVAGGNFWPQPLSILVGGQLYEARIVKAGHFEDVDLALLQLEAADPPPSLAKLSPLPVCPESGAVGQTVIVADAADVTTSVIVSSDILPLGVSRQFSSLIGDVYNTGNSGSGLFNIASGCLLGIMSRKIERKTPDDHGSIRVEGIAKYFVPAYEIRSFLGVSRDLDLKK